MAVLHRGYNGTTTLNSDKVFAGLRPPIFRPDNHIFLCPGWGEDSCDSENCISYTGTVTMWRATGYCGAVADSLMFGCGADHVLQKGSGYWMKETVYTTVHLLPYARYPATNFSSILRMGRRREVPTKKAVI